MKYLKHLLILLLIPLITSAQTELDSYTGKTTDSQLCDQELGMAADVEAQRILDDICQQIGVFSRIEAVQCSRVSNCQARLIKGLPYVFFNPTFLNRAKGLNFSNVRLPSQKDWVVIAIMAHEIGHLQNYHHALLENGHKSRIEVELEADVFAGQKLAQMGATLKQAQQALYLDDVPIEGTYRYPSRKKRLAAVKKGWDSVTKPEPDNMVYVEGGCFDMGSDDGSSDEKPVHRVCLDDFYISKYECTVAEFEQFIHATDYQTDAEKNGKSWVYDDTWKEVEGVTWRDDVKGNRRPSSDYHHPVIHVSWNDALAFCEWKSRMTGKSYRLPTEAEWEYAAKGGQKSRGYIYAGSNDLNTVAWNSRNSDSKTHPVGQKKANELGLYDMSGNVWEWVQDCYNSDVYATNDSAKNPCHQCSKSNKCSHRVLRGGSWDYDSNYCRSSNRYRNGPNVTYGYNGFRYLKDF